MGTGELSGLRDEMLDDHLAIDWHLTQAGVLMVSRFLTGISLLARPNLPLRESTEEVAVDLELELKKALQGSDWLLHLNALVKFTANGHRLNFHHSHKLRWKYFQILWSMRDLFSSLYCWLICG